MDAPETVRVPWFHRLRERLRHAFATRHRALTQHERTLTAEVTRLREQLAERDEDLRHLRNDLESARASVKLLEMELADFALLRQRTRAQWEADLSVEARRAVGPEKGR